MGGLIFILASVVTSIVCVFLFSYFESYDKDTLKVVVGLAMALAFGGIGFADDYIKVKRKESTGSKLNTSLFFNFCSLCLSFSSVLIRSNQQHSCSVFRYLRFGCFLLDTFSYRYRGCRQRSRY